LSSLRRLLTPLGPCGGLLLALLLLEQALTGLYLALLLPQHLLLHLLLHWLQQLLLIGLRLNRLGPGLRGCSAVLLRAEGGLIALSRRVDAILRPALYPLGHLAGSPLTDIALEPGLLPVNFTHRSPVFELGLPQAVIGPKLAAAVLFTLGPSRLLRRPRLRQTLALAALLLGSQSGSDRRDSRNSRTRRPFLSCGLPPGQARQQEQTQRAQCVAHVSPVSTIRRSSAMNCADCISCSLDAVRGTSWAKGPSV
jgi:hypothetical protein